MNQEATDQHTVPRYYLKGFSIDNKKSFVWEYQKDKQSMLKEPSPISRICQQPKYYRQVDGDGKEHIDLMEQGFQKYVENPGSRSMRYIIRQVLANDNVIRISPETYSKLCFVTAMQYVRVPAFRDKAYKEIESKAESATAKFVDESIRNGSIPVEALEQIVNGNKLKVQVKVFATIPIMVRKGVELSRSLLDRTPVFLKVTQRREFVTSDNPVIYTEPNGKRSVVEPIDSSNYIYYPISKDVAVFFHPIPSGFGITRRAISCTVHTIETPLVRFFNQQMLKFATNSVFSSVRDELLQFG